MCKGPEGSLIRDPFGYEGPEIDRPAIWGAMINARRNLDYQESRIAMLCSISPHRNTWKAPCYPPTDATRNDPVAFAIWCEQMEYKQALERDKSSSQFELAALEREWIGQDGQRLDDIRRSQRRRHQQCWIFYDADLKRDIACDHMGRLATAKSVKMDL